MLGRIITWLFWAAFFFLLGAWSSTYTTGVKGFLGKGVEIGVQGFESIRHWAFGTITPKPGAPAWPAPSQISVARSAFARGDITLAISTYQEHLKQNPEDTEARGELGNVFFSTGRLQEAALAYYEVALKLLDKGDLDRARALGPAIRRGNSALADELDRKLRQPAKSDERTEVPATAIVRRTG
jgi:tetratricopeptide (TPR) repeat protein